MSPKDISTLRNITYVQSQIACFYGELESMKIANKRADELDHVAQPFFEQDFKDLAEKYGLHHNQILSAM